MKMRLLGAAVALTAACCASFAQSYKVTVPLSADEDGAMAFLQDYDTGKNVDSVMVDDSKAVFEGQLSQPVVVRLIIDGKRLSQFVLEPADINVDLAKRHVSGGKYNEIDNAFGAKTAHYAEAAQKATTRAEYDSIYQAFTREMMQFMNDNIDNPLGYQAFLQMAYEMEPAQVEKIVAEHPALGKYQRVQKLIAANRNKAATQPGAMFADFEIVDNGVKHKLSDVVGKGKYVLVDYWASWCGPCIRQTAVLKDIYNKYKDSGKLEVLGVAVWDKPEDTERAIVQHQLPWTCWKNGQNVPTDVYGISGIPCIILYGPDGKILSRDKQDDELRADVDAALAK